MQAFVGSKISPHMARLNDGGLLCQGVPICRSGEQSYTPDELGITAAQLGMKPEHFASTSTIRVDRPEEEVFSRKTMASFEGAPICDDHPPGFVTTTNWRAWAAGHAQNIREGPRLPNGDRVLLADLIIRDEGLADKIERGIKRQISCGYDCTYLASDDGTFKQVGIVGNHIACVARGRAGEHIRIYDSEGSTMKNYTSAEIARALAKLAEITAQLGTREQATDHESSLIQDEFSRRLATIDGTPEAIEFCEAANMLGRRLRGLKDCRPSLRQGAAEHREVQDAQPMTAAEASVAYATACRLHHRR
jgi:hypothetical protein